MTKLVQPILVNHPEPPEKGCSALTLEAFIDLLKQEEDYWKDGDNNTRLTITRLRKIFYDQWGWDDHLITGAAHVANRYKVEIADQALPEAKKMRWRKTADEHPKFRKVTYRPDDKVHPERAGTTPEIYKCNHQEVMLPEGHCCDIGHVLAGIDAYNHRNVVGPLPERWEKLKIGPHVDNNEDIVTWLGDIASSSADFFFAYLRYGRQPICMAEEQKYIDADAPGSDMLGNIDAFVIARHYNVGPQNNQRFSEILHDYYLGTDYDPPFRSSRVSFFCRAIGLKDWNGTGFANEKKWLNHYRKQLRDNICFQAYSVMDSNFKNIMRLIWIYIGGYKKILKIDELLNIWLDALKQELQKEL